MSDSVRLTSTVLKGGCAAKIAATELRKILQSVLFPPGHEALLVDGRFFDDAAVYKVTDDVALVQTIDFFTPIVDTPRLFGRIAAANALSDVYAMGGRPKTAMAVLAFPIATLTADVISEVLQGAADLVGEANACFVGGHSIDDETLKFGLSVTGYVHPARVWTNTGAKPGDLLILTKPIGTGVSTAALKRGAVTEAGIVDATESMARLNNVIDHLSSDHLAPIHAATDITGFGLSGHLMQMASASGVRFEIEAARLPWLPRAKEFAEAEFLTKAHRTNREYTRDAIATEGLAPWQQLLIHDPQTSGGLLLSVDADHGHKIANDLSKFFPGTAVIGQVVATKSGEKVAFRA